MSSIGSFSGLASGIQWRDMVDQIMRLEQSRRLDPLNRRVGVQEKRVSAWNEYRSLVSTLNSAAKKLSGVEGFGAFSVTTGTNPSSGRALFSATASSSATPGSHKVEVLSLARAEKLSGSIVRDPTAQLGLSGDFVVSGQKVTVATTDSLNAIRDKINAVNSGSSASGVTATILSTSGSDHRLVLTSDQTGAGGIDVTEGTGGVLQGLGVLDGTLVANKGADGSARSQRFSSTTASIAAMLGVSMPPPSTIKVGGKTISVDLSTDSLASIAAKIQTAGIAAEVVEEKVAGVARHRIRVGDTVEVDTADATNSRRALEALGFLEGGRSSIAQSAVTGNVLYEKDGVTVATAATKLVNLNGGAKAGDTFTMQGTRADGSTVTLTHTVTNTDTLQTVLNKLNNATDGFGAGSRPATATLDGGRIRLTDQQGGDSQLGFSMSTNNAGGGTLSFGATTTDVVGRAREVVTGTDAQLRLDGVLLNRYSNTVTDALAGVTLKLEQAEAGTVLDLNIARDRDAVVENVQAFAKAFNEVKAFFDRQRKDGAPLHANGSLRNSVQSFKDVLLTSAPGLEGETYNRLTMVGVSLTQTGTLEVDATKLKELLATNYEDVRRLFNSSGSATDGRVQYVSATSQTQAGTYAVDITAAATQATKTGAGFSGTYADDGTADTMSISDAFSGKNGSISLQNGDTIDTVVGKLNSLFADQGMKLSASKSGNDLVISGSEYGSNASYTVSYTSGGTDSTGQLGFAAGTYAGTDVQGTIGGLAATGSGRILKAGAGGAAEGLAIQYAGTATGSMGTVTYTLGVMGSMARAAQQVVRATDGLVDSNVNTLNTSIDSLERRVDNVQEQLDRKREQLIRQFTAMEDAIGQIQAQGNWMAGQLLSLMQPQA